MRAEVRMWMIRFVVTVAWLVILLPNVQSQIRVDTARGFVGKEVDIPFFYDVDLTLDSGSIISLQGDFKLTQPTVFYPQVFRPGTALHIVDSTLSRSTDSTGSWSITLQLTRDMGRGEVLFSLAGEALAGTDSVTQLLFTNVMLDGSAITSLTAVVITESVGTRLPYVRFAVLDPGRPNPTTIGKKVTWGFKIDKESEVFFKIYDLLGREVSVQDFGVLQKGVYINTFTPDITTPNGVFVVRLITNSGEATQVMHVVKSSS